MFDVSISTSHSDPLFPLFSFIKDPERPHGFNFAQSLPGMSCPPSVSSKV